jgi:nucleotide-binding universal stress UspA family protein
MINLTGPGKSRDNEVKEAPAMYKNILVPMDGSELAECVLPHVETIVRGCNSPTVIFARVVEPTHSPFGAGTDGGTVFTEQEANKVREDIDRRNKVEAQQYLTTLAGRTKYDNAEVQTILLSGHPAESLAEYVRKNNIDLVIMSTHGRSGVSRWVWGSTADKLLRSACVPVMMVRAPGCVNGI